MAHSRNLTWKKYLEKIFPYFILIENIKNFSLFTSKLINLLEKIYVD